MRLVLAAVVLVGLVAAEQKAPIRGPKCAPNQVPIHLVSPCFVLGEAPEGQKTEVL